MSNNQQFDINGIRVNAVPFMGGYLGVPVDFGQAIQALRDGKLTLDNILTGKGLTITPVAEAPVAEAPVAEAPVAEASRSTKPVDETVKQYRERNDMSRTQMAEFIGISRRSLGRWEASGRRMSEV